MRMPREAFCARPDGGSLSKSHIKAADGEKLGDLRRVKLVATCLLAFSAPPRSSQDCSSIAIAVWVM